MTLIFDSLLSAARKGALGSPGHTATSAQCWICFDPLERCPVGHRGGASVRGCSRCGGTGYVCTYHGHRWRSLGASGAIATWRDLA